MKQITVQTSRGPVRFHSVGEPIAGIEAPAKQTAQHTPGPWHVATYGEGQQQFLAVKHGSLSVCRVTQVDPLEDTTGAANARLIAASPDLLAALKYALPYVEFRAKNPLSGVQRSSARADVEIIRAAIARAKGGS